MLSIPHVGTPAQPLYLAQPWLELGEPGFQPAAVRLHWSDTNLHIHVELTDRHIFSESTAHSQNLFQLGDTLEVFLMLPDAPQYYELHVSPHNHRTLLRWPLGAIDRVRRDRLSLEDFKENPHAFDSRVQPLDHDNQGWEASLDIPHTLLGIDHFLPGQALLLSISRYDYLDLDTPPILSTIAAHKIKNFHRTEDWLPVELT